MGYYGDFGLPYSGMVSSYTNGKQRGTNSLKFPSSNSNDCSYVNIPVNKHQFGKYYYGSNWYPGLDIDSIYNPGTGGYGYPNASAGPYFAVGLGNYPRSMYKELKYGKASPKRKVNASPKRKVNASPKRKVKASPKRKVKASPKRKVKSCGKAAGLNNDSYPVNTRKKCSAALSYSRYAPNECGLARCVIKNCPKGTGKSSKLIKDCKIKLK